MYSIRNWLVVSTHLKNISQNGNLSVPDATWAKITPMGHYYLDQVCDLEHPSPIILAMNIRLNKKNIHQQHGTQVYWRQNFSIRSNKKGLEINRSGWTDWNFHVIFIYIYNYNYIYSSAARDPYILTIRPSWDRYLHLSTPQSLEPFDTSLIQGGCTLELRLDGKQEVEGSMGYKLLINGIPSRELIYTPKNCILKMIFLFPRWDILVPWRVYWG